MNRKGFFILIMICAFLVVGCDNNDERGKVVNPNITVQKESISYVEECIDMPFSANSFQMDFITEDSIGLLKNPDGRLEWYTISRSVKEKYRVEAEEYIENEKVFELEWFEYRVWRFILDSERQWKREEVVLNKGIADESALYVNAKVFYGADNNLYLIMRYEKELGDERKEYKFSVFNLMGDAWTLCNEVAYQDEDGLGWPVSYYVNSMNNFLIAQSNGTIRSYNLKTGEENDVSSDFSFDVGDVIFKDGMGYSKDDDNNRVVVFDDDTLVEEYSISIPERAESGSEVFAITQDDKMLLLNRMGVYMAEKGDEGFSKVSATNMFYSASLDSLIFRELVAIDQNEFYVSMYDNSTEEMESLFSCCKGVNSENEK